VLAVTPAVVLFVAKLVWEAVPVGVLGVGRHV
jgi:hypothetical protein